jgi:hypothetical protein
MVEGQPGFDVLVMSNYDYIDDTDECMGEETSAGLSQNEPLSNFGQLLLKGKAEESSAFAGSLQRYQGGMESSDKARTVIGKASSR